MEDVNVFSRWFYIRWSFFPFLVVSFTQWKKSKDLPMGQSETKKKLQIK